MEPGVVEMTGTVIFEVSEVPGGKHGYSTVYKESKAKNAFA